MNNAKRNRRIAIIDDEVEIGETIQAHLGEIYADVEFFSDPVKAQEALLSKPYSLILSDVNMPILPGPDLVRFSRSQGILAPIIFLTGYANKENVLAALRLGVADVLEKPYDVDELLKSIERVFEIEKRKTQLVLDGAQSSLSEGKIEKQKKMLGLLQVVNEKKKVI